MLTFEIFGKDLPRNYTALVLARLTEARLLSSGRNSIDIAHEALIRHWPRLRDWLAEDRDGHRSHRRLTEAAVEWDRHDRDADLLYRGARLETWEGRPTGRLNDTERTFLAASRDTAERERRSRRRRVRFIVGGLSSATVVVTVLAVVALTMTGRADDQRKPAVSRQLVADARAQLPVDPELGLLLAREAYTAAPSEDAEAVLRKAATDSHIRTTLGGSSTQIRFRATDSLTGAVFGPDGKHVVTSNTSAALQVRTWDDPWAWRGKIAFSSDGRRVASGSSDGTVRIRNTADDDQPTVLDSSESLSGWSAGMVPLAHSSTFFLSVVGSKRGPGAGSTWGMGFLSSSSLSITLQVPVPAAAAASAAGARHLSRSRTRLRRLALVRRAATTASLKVRMPLTILTVAKTASGISAGPVPATRSDAAPRSGQHTPSTPWQHGYGTECGRRAAGHNHPRGPNGRTRGVRASAAESPPILAHADERTPE